MPANSATQANARAFLAAFRLTGDITRAAAAAKIDRSLHYQWKRSSPSYAEAFKRACDEFGDDLEAEAIRQAKEGILTPVFYQGAPCGAVRVFSPGLLMFLMRGFKPEKYGAKTELTGAGGGPVEITVKFVRAKPQP